MGMTASAEAEFTPIVQGLWLEGLHVEGDDIWYTDVVIGGVRRVASDDVLLPERAMVGGLLMNADGSLLVAGIGGIAWANPATGASGMLAGGFDGTNEMCADAAGGVIFGSIDLPAIVAGRKPGTSSIWRIAVDGTRTELASGMAFANGLALAADGATLFFNESFSASRAFPVRADGLLGAPRLFADKADCDGMARDAEGNLWITGFSSDFLLCLTPDGTEVRRVALPGKAASSVRFGGADMRDLYVTIVDPASAQLLASGRPLTERTSVLYRTRAPVAGAPVARTAFQL